MFDHFVVIWRRWVDIKALAEKEKPERLQYACPTAGGNSHR